MWQLKYIIGYKKRSKLYKEWLSKNSLIYKFNSIEKPNQITVSYIRGIINRPLIYYLSTNKIPKTKKHLVSIIEDTYKFRKRKIQWAIKVLIYKTTVYNAFLIKYFKYIKKDKVTFYNFKMDTTFFIIYICNISYI